MTRISSSYTFANIVQHKNVLIEVNSYYLSIWQTNQHKSNSQDLLDE